YLLGSVHMLKAADSELPSEALRAYAAAKVLVMEVDLNGAGAESLLESGAELETLPEGQTLAPAVGPQLYAHLLARAGHQPDVAEAGFDAAAGVDEQFGLVGEADQNPNIGLEIEDRPRRFFA